MAKAPTKHVRNKFGHEQEAATTAQLESDRATIAETAMVEMDAALSGGTAHKWVLHVGATVLIRGMTMMYTGRVVALSPTDIELEDAAWVASTGRRYGEFLALGALPGSTELEPYPGEGRVQIGRFGVEVTAWNHKLPREAM